MIEGLYIHVPFCDGKCHYCAFYSVPYTREKGAAWLSALKREAEEARAEFGPFTFSTVFMGGGTPTLLPQDQLEELLGVVGRTPVTEWTCEANPGSLDAGKLGLMKAAGVNRISLGVQSFDDRVLCRLGRRHTVKDIHLAIDAIGSAGFTNWGMDLIACVPGVDEEAWRATLRKAVASAPVHVSVYALTSEEGTRLHQDQQAGGISLLEDEEQLRMLDAAEDELGRAGLRRYEISNYARPGFECRHNLSCWRGGEYLGLGCAASSRVGARRWTTEPDLDSYLRGRQREEEVLTPETDAVERVVFGLRMSEGINLAAIIASCGLVGAPLEETWRTTFVRLQREGLVESSGDQFRLTHLGQAWADHVAVELMP